MSDRRLQLRAPTFEEEVARHEGLLRRWAMSMVACKPVIDVEEIINVGRLVLWEQWDKWSESYNVKFFSFASTVVRRRMMWEACRLGETIHVPRQRNYAEWSNLRVPMASLDEKRPDGSAESDEATTLDRLAGAAGDPAEEAEVSSNIARAMMLMDLLPERQRQAVRLCYVQGMTRREAAPIMGITRQRVDQLANDGLVMLRRAMLEERALTYAQRRAETKKKEGRVRMVVQGSSLDWMASLSPPPILISQKRLDEMNEKQREELAALDKRAIIDPRKINQFIDLAREGLKTK